MAVKVAIRPFRLVFTSNEVGSCSQSSKNAHDLLKIGAVSGVIKLTESESEESERFHFLQIFIYNSVAFDAVKSRLSELEAEAEEPTNHKDQNRALSLVDSFTSASDSSIRDGVISGTSILLPAMLVLYHSAPLFMTL